MAISDHAKAANRVLRGEKKINSGIAWRLRCWVSRFWGKFWREGKGGDGKGKEAKGDHSPQIVCCVERDKNTANMEDLARLCRRGGGFCIMGEGPITRPRMTIMARGLNVYWCAQHAKCNSTCITRRTKEKRDVTDLVLTLPSKVPAALPPPPLPPPPPPPSVSLEKSSLWSSSSPP